MKIEEMLQLRRAAPGGTWRVVKTAYGLDVDAFDSDGNEIESTEDNRPAILAYVVMAGNEMEKLLEFALAYKRLRAAEERGIKDTIGLMMELDEYFERLEKEEP